MKYIGCQLKTLDTLSRDKRTKTIKPKHNSKKTSKRLLKRPKTKELEMGSAALVFV